MERFTTHTGIAAPDVEEFCDCRVAPARDDPAVAVDIDFGRRTCEGEKHVT